MELEEIREKALLTDGEIMHNLRPIIGYHLKPTDNFIARLDDFREIIQIQVDKILKADRIRIEADDQSLPEIPKFQYEESERKRGWLQRGAINYSKMLSNWVKCLPREGKK